jgi:diguanylate cyclase (GGDEF)-like protein
MQSQKKIFNFYKFVVIALGGLSLLFALLHVEANIFDWRFAGYAVLTLLVAFRMSLISPHSKFVLSFSDSMIFLTFLLFGGDAAIFIATLEMLATCLYLRYSGIFIQRINILINISNTAITTALTYGTLVLASKFIGISSDLSDPMVLISTLGILALSQFFFSSCVASIFFALQNNESVFKVWKNESYSSSLTYVIGAGLAGVIYQLIKFDGIVSVLISLGVFALVYFTFRRSMSQLASSMKKAEQAEREKAEAERLRAEQAERHIEVLNAQLVKEEQISEALQQSKDAFEYAALHDSLTDLFNRSYLIDRLKLLLDMGIQRSNQYFILFLDLKSFKNINDSLGHNTGDKVLKLVANRLLRTVHQEDTVARLGGDEFAIILNNVNSVEEAEEYARRIYQKLSSPFSVQGNRIFTKPNIGIAPLERDYKTPEEILRDADIAMHHAKDSEIPIAVFNTQIRDRFLEKIKLESDLRFAIERR